MGVLTSSLDHRTQCVPQARLHTGCVHMADAALVLWLHKHSQLHVPQGLHCHLQDRGKHYRYTRPATTPQLQ